MGNINYDSATDTLKHILKVREYIDQVIRVLLLRGCLHDRSKLTEPEKKFFDEFTPRLSCIQYGSDEYFAVLKRMSPAISHHHKHNSHHPEYHGGNITNMNLLDIVEMLCDWKASTKRNKDGNIRKSLEHASQRWNVSKDISKILKNTISLLDW